METLRKATKAEAMCIRILMVERLTEGPELSRISLGYVLMI